MSAVDFLPTRPARQAGLPRRTADADWMIRHRYLVISVSLAVSVWLQCDEGDWELLGRGAHLLFSSHGFATYVDAQNLQAGPPSLAAVGLLQLLTFGHGVWLAHVFLAAVFLAVLRIAELAAQSRDSDHGHRCAEQGHVRGPVIAALCLLPVWDHLLDFASVPDVARRLPLIAAPLIGLAYLTTGRAIRPASRLVAARRVARGGGPAQVLVLGLLAAPLWGYLAGTTPHLDDGLAILACGLTMVAVLDGRWASAGLLAGLAIAFKPWAVAALPLLTGLPNRRRKAASIALAVPALAWLPFLAVHPATLGAGARSFAMAPNTVLAVLGLQSATAPGWLRSVQLGAIVLCAWLATRCGEWYFALGAGLVARLIFDPQTWFYYNTTVLLAIVVGDLVGKRVPWRSVLFATTVWILPFSMNSALPVWLRPAVLGVLVASYAGIPMEPVRATVLRFRPAAREVVSRPEFATVRVQP